MILRFHEYDILSRSLAFLVEQIKGSKQLASWHPFHIEGRIMILQLKNEPLFDKQIIMVQKIYSNRIVY